MQYSNIHRDFILKPITEELTEAIDACATLGHGMEFYPLNEYLLQSLFLKMTGFQEQKLKCICWIMATFDYTYRRTLLGDNDALAECSSLNAKTSVYKRLLECIDRIKNQGISVRALIRKDDIAQYTHDCMKLFRHSLFAMWKPDDYCVYESHKGLFRANQFCNDANTLIQTELIKVYDTLYAHRNRCAHNTISYQDNYPSLKALGKSDYIGGYSIWFALLILIDKIFMELFLVFEKSLIEEAE